jgi:hypothetical protein
MLPRLCLEIYYNNGDNSIDSSKQNPVPILYLGTMYYRLCEREMLQFFLQIW